MARSRWTSAVVGVVVTVAMILSIGGTNVLSAASLWRYSVIIDAGSSGSRVYIYRWHLGKCLLSGIPNVTAVLKPDGQIAVLKIEPGLSSFRHSPHKAAESLGPLLRFAEAHIPPAQHATTPIRLMATAGVRMLPAAIQQEIVAEVRRFIVEMGAFHVPSDAIEVMAGERESLFTWIAANYGLGRFSAVDQSAATYGCLDMGGASAQVAYEVGPTIEIGGPGNGGGQWVVEMIWGRRVYAGTLSGFGANEARRRHVERVIANVAEGEVGIDPCLPPGLITEVMRPNGDPTPISLVGTGSFDDCLAGVKPLLRTPAYGSFADTMLPAPAHVTAPWYGISEYWYTMEDVFGIGGLYNAVKFRQKARVFCGTDWAVLTQEHAKGIYPKAKPQRFRDQCFKSAWVRAMLHDGYRFPMDSESFQSASEVGGLPLQWTLGAALYNLAKRTQCEPAVVTSGSGGGAATVDASTLYLFVTLAVVAAVGLSVARRRSATRSRQYVSHA